MVTLTPFWEKYPIGYLVRARFPSVRLEDTILLGPFDLNDIPSRMQREAEAYRDELEKLDLEEIDRRVAEQRKLDKETARLNAEREEARIWYNQPASRADFDHWAKMAMWSIDEGVALSLGRDPRTVTWKRISAHVHVSPLASTFADRRSIALRALSAGQLWQPTIAGVFLAWAARMKLSVPDDLTKAVSALGVQIDDWKSRYEMAAARVQTVQEKLLDAEARHLTTINEHTAYLASLREGFARTSASYDALIAEKSSAITALETTVEGLRARIAELDSAPAAKFGKSLGVKERESLLKMVIGMLIKGYGYDPRSGRSSIAKEISSDLALVGLSLDEDTVRKYLSEAKQLLPGDETE